MLTKPSYTRITLALDIMKRISGGPSAGYHELGVVKHQINLHDIITITPSERMCITCDDSRVPLDSSNVCWKAAEILKKVCGISENVAINIEKRIPVQGGLAGGSANAATVIEMLNELWGIGLGSESLERIGAGAGRDVPYFFTGRTCFDTETGAIEPIKTPLSIHCVLCIPPFGISTRDAYGMIDYSRIGREREKTAQMRSALERGDSEAVAQYLHNDFELFVFSRHPLLAQIKKALIDAGCSGAVMSGSGSTVFGLAQDEKHAVKVCNSLQNIATCMYVQSMIRR